MTLNTYLRDELIAAAPSRVRFDEPMRFHTTFHIGGPAEVWAEPQDEQQLRRLLAVARKAGQPVTMVGGGANLLVRDEGIPGLVIHLGSPGFQGCRRKGNTLIAQAALPLDWLIRQAQKEGLSGVEFLAGVPGRVGGAIRMNAGTHDEEGRVHQIGDVVDCVKVMTPSGEIRVIPAGEMGFQYRSTRLNGEIVLEAELRLTPDAPNRIEERVKQLWAYKKWTQDWSAPSVGCIFKNPRGLLANGSKIPGAGWLVEQAGLKGRKAGGAVISPTHANFIVNAAGARAADVFTLIDEARASVKKKFGVDLELEVQVLPVHPELVEG